MHDLLQHVFRSSIALSFFRASKPICQFLQNFFKVPFLPEPNIWAIFANLSA
jgi:hypothetical protein